MTSIGVVEFFTSAVLEPDDSILRMFAALGRQLGAFVGRSRTQEQVEGFFTMSQDLLCVAGFDGYFKRVNGSWTRVLGYTPEELLAEPHVNLVHLEDRAATIAQLTSLRAGGLMNSFENRYRCKDGSYKWLLWTAIAKPDEEIIYAVARDNTDRKLIEQQTQDTLQMRNDFVSFVTHQLRTPLSGIEWMLELAAEGTDADEKTSYIQDAHESADRLIGLVNDLLDASRLESGKLRVVLEAVNLRTLTGDVLDDVTTLVREKGHTVTVESAADLPDVTSDPQLLRQVVMNLLSNAIKYTPPGGRIAIRMGLDGRNLRWSIHDSGIGIPKASAARLFEKFFRADNVHTVDTEGTGLGLYLVRLIVERFGGTVTCESEEGRGTTFAFTLPRAGALAHDQVHSARRGRQVPAAGGRNETEAGRVRRPRGGGRRRSARAGAGTAARSDAARPADAQTRRALGPQGPQGGHRDSRHSRRDHLELVQDLEMQNASDLGAVDYWIKSNLSLQELCDRVQRLLGEAS